MDTGFLAFLGISALVIATPGPDTALTVRNTFTGGRRAGIFTALGVSLGQIVWAIATSAGLIAVLLASGPVFRAIQLAGALYLVFLGIQSLISAFRGSPERDAATPAIPERARLGDARAFRQGVINNLANPKMAVFFASVLPQFAPQGRGMLSALVMLGIVFATMTFLWLALYAAIIARAGVFVRDSRVRCYLAGFAGAALIGLGIKIAMEERP